MSKARDLANLIAAGNPLADGSITVAEISDLTASAAELNNVAGVTSSIQTQLDSAVSSLSDLGVSATSTELNYVSGTTSNIQTQLNAAASTGKAIAMAIVFG